MLDPGGVSNEDPSRIAIQGSGRAARTAGGASARSIGRSPWMRIVSASGIRIGRAIPVRVWPTTTRPPSIGIEAKETISSLRGSSPVVSKSTTRSGPRARASGVTAALPACRRSRPRRSVVVVLLAVSPGEGQLALQRALHGADRTKRVADVAPGRWLQGLHAMKSSGSTSLPQLLDLVVEPQLPEEIVGLVERTGVTAR